MISQVPEKATTLFESDETAWLEATADLVRHGRTEEIDRETLAEYLTDIARRDRREVFSRLVVLMAHLLKWEHQPDHRGGSWQATILEQQRELRQLLQSCTLRNHAVAVLDDAYDEARKQAAAETELPRATFPARRPWDLEQTLADRGDEAAPHETNGAPDQ